MRAFMTPRFAGLLALAVIIAVLPAFLQNNFQYDIAIRVAFNAIVVVGLNLLIGYTGQISLGHAGFLGLGAYFSAITATTFNWPPVVSLVVAAVLVGLLAFIVARPILRLKGHYLAMATLGLGIIVSIVLNQEAWLTGGPDGMTVAPFGIAGFELKTQKQWYWVAGILLLLATWLCLNIIDSPVGRALRAVHGSEVAAEVVGVDTTRFKVLVFVVSAVFASIVGSLSAHYVMFLSPMQAGFFHSVELVIMVVLGGMASTFGGIVGAAILTSLPQFLTVLEDYEHMIFGLIMMLVMIFLPKGIVPSIQGLLRRGAK
ncbi:branched-chain amino acid ABC transporter permease [Novispirillum sp. DQ9]|uniref:branched-chain amino acid ABC transporter permease n=1 Tax=Novispirillum sp. DQ9 TaxID=3398612 RepID=UPI003C7BF2A1